MISSKFKSNTNSNKIILLSLIDTHANYGLLNKVFIFILLLFFKKILGLTLILLSLLGSRTHKFFGLHWGVIGMEYSTSSGERLYLLYD